MRTTKFMTDSTFLFAVHATPLVALDFFFRNKMSTSAGHFMINEFRRGKKV